MGKADIFRCNEGHAFDRDGVTYTVTKGSLARAGHPVLIGHEQYYEPVILDYDLPADDEAENNGPEIRSSSGRTQGARSR